MLETKTHESDRFRLGLNESRHIMTDLTVINIFATKLRKSYKVAWQLVMSQVIIKYLKLWVIC